MKFTKKKINLFNYKTGEKDLPVDAECLVNVAVHKDINMSQADKHYMVTLINSGMGVVSTRAMHEPEKPWKLREAKALALAIEQQVTADLRVAILSEEALEQLRVLVHQFRHRKPLKLFTD